MVGSLNGAGKLAEGIAGIGIQKASHFFRYADPGDAGAQDASVATAGGHDVLTEDVEGADMTKRLGGLRSHRDGEVIGARSGATGVRTIHIHRTADWQRPDVSGCPKAGGKAGDVPNYYVLQSVLAGVGHHNANDVRRVYQLRGAVAIVVDEGLAAIGADQQRAGDADWVDGDAVGICGTDRLCSATTDDADCRCSDDVRRIEAVVGRHDTAYRITDTQGGRESAAAQ